MQDGLRYTRFGRTIKFIELQATNMICPVHIVMHTNFGSVVLNLFAFPYMPGKNYVLVLGCQPLEICVLDICFALTHCGRLRTEGESMVMKMVKYIACRCWIMLLGTLQNYPMNDQLPYQAMKRVAERNPEMMMGRMVERKEPRVILEQTVSTTARNGYEGPRQRCQRKWCWSSGEMNFKRLQSNPSVIVDTLH